MKTPKKRVGPTKSASNGFTTKDEDGPSTLDLHVEMKDKEWRTLRRCEGALLPQSCLGEQICILLLPRNEKIAKKVPALAWSEGWLDRIDVFYHPPVTPSRFTEFSSLIGMFAGGFFFFFWVNILVLIVALLAKACDHSEIYMNKYLFRYAATPVTRDLEHKNAPWWMWSFANKNGLTLIMLWGV